MGELEAFFSTPDDKEEGLVLPCLDKGYVRLRDYMGGDVSVVNAARVSFARQVEVLGEADKKLIRYLAEHDHTSPFRHAVFSFEINAPLMVARQWWKYVIGGDHALDAWNEASRRYITLEPEFYSPEPTAWRSAPKNKKQGSGVALPEQAGASLTYKLETLQEQALQLYNEALAAGVAPEQARLFLPAYGMYTKWMWTASLQSVCHFLNQRLANDAQYEIQVYAHAVHKLVQPFFPESIKALVVGYE